MNFLTIKVRKQSKTFSKSIWIHQNLCLFQSNTPLACCGDGKLPREPLIIIRFTNSVFGLLTFARIKSVSYTHLRAHETRHDLVCRLLLEKKKKKKIKKR